MLKFKNYFYMRLEKQLKYEFPNGRPHWALDYYKNSMAVYDRYGTPIISEPNSIYLVPPNIPSIHTSVSGKPWMHTTIVFNADTNYLDRFGISYMTPIHIENTKDLEQLFFDMQQHNVTTSVFKNDAQESYLRLVLIHIHNMLHSYTEAYRVNAGDDLQRVKNTVMNSKHMDWTINEMAAMANMSIRSFQRNYTKLYGTTPIADLYEFRFICAKRLLADGFSINHIIKSCGFKSSQHFSAFFKQRSGMTPSEYRKRNK